jgi:hypothetical protein
VAGVHKCVYLLFPVKLSVKAKGRARPDLFKSPTILSS